MIFRYDLFWYQLLDSSVERVNGKVIHLGESVQGNSFRGVNDKVAQLGELRTRLEESVRAVNDKVNQLEESMTR